MRILHALGAGLFAIGCTKASSQDDHVAVKAPVTLDPALAERFDAAPLAFVGTPTAIGASPGIWSGRYPSFQAVTYRVDEYLKVDRPGHGQSITVHHPLVSGSKTADVNVPQLSGELFRTDRKLLVLARRDGEKVVAIDENEAVRAADDDVVAALRAHTPAH